MTVSVDAELGWGWHDLSSPPRDRLAAGREGWRRLVELFDEFELPATWAVVGHLMLEDCDGYHRSHPAGPEWFERERREWCHRRDLRFADGLVDDLLGATADHEIGCHTFSHVPLGAPETTAETAAAELTRAAEVAAERGLSPSTVVFPRNQVGHRRVLADCGFEVYRGHRPTAWAGSSVVPSPLAKVAHATLPGMSPPTVRPRVDEFGLVNVPASLYLFGIEGAARSVAERIGTDPIVAQARRGIDEAAKTGEVFHMWLHPNNVRQDSDVRRLRAVFEHLERRRSEGAVSVATVGQVATRAERTAVATD